MIRKAATPLEQLYEADETAWVETMAELIQQRRWKNLDYAHLEEYLTDMARRDRREVRSRLIVLLSHLLKWTFQPDRRSNSWRGTITEQRQELSFDAAKGVLRRHAEEILADCYARAVERTADETGLPTSSFLAECPYTLDQLMSPDLLAD